MKNNGIILRVDYHEFSDNISRICCFCKDCDPEAKGGNGGVLPDMVGNDVNYYKTDPDYQKHYRYCPTCGKEIDYDKAIIIDKGHRS